ncbi:MAG: CAP domain-containing protein [Microcoleaceae cyanobacterium]
MVLFPNTEFGFMMGDNSAESIVLSPGQLSSFPFGVLTLGGNDTVGGSSDSELILTNTDLDSVFAGDGNDTVFGGKQGDFLNGEGGNDFLYGNLGEDTLDGGIGDDQLFGGRDNDSVVGGLGNDIVYGDLGNDILTGGEGADVFGLGTSSDDRDIITDFEDGVDLLRLPSNFNEVTIQDIGNNQTSITLTLTGEEIVILEGIEASAISSDDFDNGGVIVNGGSPITEPPIDSSFVDEVVQLTNQFRQDNGLDPLSFDPQLATAAQTHSQNMAIEDFFSHTGVDGSNIGDRVDAVEYDFFTAGENIAAGYSTPETVVDGWINSDGHRANLLNPDFTEIGVGHFFLENDTGDTNFNHYWTQVFAAPL